MISKKNKIEKISTCSMIALFFTFSIVFLGGLEAKAASEEERVAKLIEGARQEGNMTLYTSQGLAEVAMVVKKFEEKYPFIKVQLNRGSGAARLNRILAESKAKKFMSDVVGLVGFEVMIVQKEGMFTRYVSPESRAYQEGFKDPDGKWTAFYTQPMIIGYNTRLLSRKDIPDTYEGFLRPRWKGKKIGFDNREVEWFANILKIMGKEKGTDFFRKLVAQQLSYRQGRTLITDLIIAGEFPVGTVYIASLEERKKKGAHIDWVGVSPLIVKFHAIGLSAHAPHPNAAKLYIDFCLSKEGQTLLANLNQIPARADIDVGLLKEFKGLKMYPSDISLVENYAEYKEQFIEMMKAQ